MITTFPPRLRAPLRILATGVVIVVVAIVGHGWGPPVYTVLIPFVLAAAAAYYVWGGRDSDTSAVIRRDMDERQTHQRLQIQALVGKVMSLAAAVAYLVAVSVNATLWPFGIALGLPLLTAIAGWLTYREHRGADDDSLAHHA
jgi:hypothetical protein